MSGSKLELALRELQPNKSPNTRDVTTSKLSTYSAWPNSHQSASPSVDSLSGLDPAKRQQSRATSPDGPQDSWTDRDSGIDTLSRPASSCSTVSSPTSSPATPMSSRPDSQSHRVAAEVEDTISQADSAVDLHPAPLQDQPNSDVGNGCRSNDEETQCPAPMEVDSFLRVWKEHTSLAGQAGQHRAVESRSRAAYSRWLESVYFDESGRLGVVEELRNEQHRQAIRDEPKVYGAPACHWHKTKAPPRSRNQKRSGEEQQVLPRLVLTDSEGNVWFLSDLRYYADNGGDISGEEEGEGEEEEEDESVYW